jgi:multidrug efflux pump subunit AcrA (membrane-fusion protein)
VLIVGALALAGCTSGEDDGIVTGEVTRGDVLEIVEAPATVTPRATATLTAAATGTVDQLAVKDGQRVAAGDLILVIDSPGAEQALEQARRADAQAAEAARIPDPDLDLGVGAQADAAAAQAFAAAREAAAAIPDPTTRARALAQIAQAEAQYAAARARGAAAAAQLQAGLSALADTAGALAGAQRLQTKAAVAAAEATVDALRVTAPIPGVVSLGGAAGSASGSDLSSLTDSLPSSLAGAAALLGGGGGGASTSGELLVGSPVQSGDTVATVVDTGALSLAATVDETDVLLVEPGIPATVEIDAVPGARYSATVVSVDPSGAGGGGGGVGFAVRLTLGGGTDEAGDPAPTPKPGMSAVARLEVRDVTDVLVVPAAAVFRDAGSDTVWVVGASGAEKRPVRLGAQGEDTIEVVEGLAEGEVIVTAGADRVTEGQQIP